MTEQTPYQNVTFPSNGGTAHGYLVVPESGSGPGLIVIREWWGLTDTSPTSPTVSRAGSSSGRGQDTG